MEVLHLFADPADYMLIKRIAERAAKEFETLDRSDILMDIMHVHLNDIPLDLDKLLGFPIVSFGHDVLGIDANMERSTGRLNPGFIPRSSALLTWKD